MVLNKYRLSLALPYKTGFFSFTNCNLSQQLNFKSGATKRAVNARNALKILSLGVKIIAFDLPRHHGEEANIAHKT